MTDPLKNDWDPESYASFRGLRLRPAIDLMGQVGPLPDGDVIDLGCGDGAVGPALAGRFAGRRLIGVDTSSAMLDRAQGYDELVQAEVGGWAPKTPPALIFSNACLHWLADHATLMPRLVGLLAKGGTLAVQMPRQYAAPSHALLRDIAKTGPFTPPVGPLQDYIRMLARFGDVSAWETDYIQRLDAVDHGHPVRAFTQSTAMRPFVAGLGDAQQADFISNYDAALKTAYPIEADGSVLFPFKRLFFVIRT